MDQIIEMLAEIERQLDIGNRLMAYHITHPPVQGEGYAEMIRRDTDVARILARKREGDEE